MTTDLRNRLNESFRYEPVQYHDTWLSIDPIIGCSHNCQYCYLQLANWTGVKPQKVFSAAEIVAMLQAHRHFVPHKTPLAMGNTTDIFLPENRETAIEVAQKLDECGYTNPLAFITKKFIPLEAIAEFKRIRHVRLIFVLSYSGLPPSVEKGVNSEDNRKNFKNLAEHGLPTIHYWRPLINLNGSKEKLEEILDFATHYASSSIYIGLRYNSTLSQLYKHNADLGFPDMHQNRYDEYIPSQVRQNLKKIAAKKYPEYPLYKHTSCAVSNLLNQADYNATQYNKRICCGSTCPAKQRSICQAARTFPTEGKVQALLNNIGKSVDFRITDNHIEIYTTIDQQDYSYLLHNLNYPIKVKVKLTGIWRGSILRDNEQQTQARN